MSLLETETTLEEKAPKSTAASILVAIGIVCIIASILFSSAEPGLFVSGVVTGILMIVSGMAFAILVRIEYWLQRIATKR